MSLEDKIRNWAAAGRRRLLDEAKRRIREKPSKMSRLGIDGNLVLTDSSLERKHNSRGNALPKKGKIVPLDNNTAYLNNVRTKTEKRAEERAEATRSKSDAHSLNANVDPNTDDEIFASIHELESGVEPGPAFQHIGWVTLKGWNYKNVTSDYVQSELPTKWSYTSESNGCCTTCIDSYGDEYQNCWSLYTPYNVAWQGSYNANSESKFDRSYEVDVISMTLSDKNDRYSPYNENKYTGARINWFYSERRTSYSNFTYGWLYEIKSFVRSGCNTGCPPNMSYHDQYYETETASAPSAVFEGNPRFLPVSTYSRNEMVYSADHENVYYAWVVSRIRNNQLKSYTFHNGWVGNYLYSGIGPDSSTCNFITEAHYMTHNYKTGATNHQVIEVFNEIGYGSYSSNVPGTGKHSYYLEGYTFPWDGTTHNDWWENMQPGSLHYEMKDFYSNYKETIINANNAANSGDQNFNGYTYDRINGCLYKTIIIPDFDYEFNQFHYFAEAFDVWFRWVPPDPNFEDPDRDFYSTIIRYGLEQDDINNYDPNADDIYGWRKIRDNNYNYVSERQSDLFSCIAIPQYGLSGDQVVVGEEINPYEPPGEEN